MGIRRFEEDMDIIVRLSRKPNADDGMTMEDLQRKFDEGGKKIQKYLNNTLAPYLDGVQASTVEVGTIRPQSSPALWMDTDTEQEEESEDKNATITYIDAFGVAHKIYPKIREQDIAALNSLKSSLCAKEVILSKDGWSSEKPYRQRIEVRGMTDAWVPGAFTLIPTGYEPYDKDAKNWASYVDIIESGEGFLEFTCYDVAPKAELRLRIPGSYAEG